MAKRVLVTGGAGFIGAHVCQALLEAGHAVRAFDNLSPQVHGAVPAQSLPADVEFMRGDMRDEDRVKAALSGVDAVVHLAASVGVGQSMYEIVSYTETNEVGTAVLLEQLAKHPVERLVCASSMSVYGEGLARRTDGVRVAPDERPLEQLRSGRWELLDADGAAMEPLPTPETKPPTLSSVYALNKYAQERLCLIFGKAYKLPVVALRFFNVYGPGQALSNPYTGVLAIFASRLLNGKSPLVFEDGLQRRDFVHVSDIARACLLALEAEDGVGEVYNIGSGEPRTILSIAHDLARVMGKAEIEPTITAKFRAGDIRHCFADIGKVRGVLGFAPQVVFETGLAELAEWLSGQVAEDLVERATAELESRGLVA